MAAPATHILLAEKIYKKHFPDKNYNKYIVGTSFPDIRYLGEVKRQKTHYKNPKLADAKNERSFNAGVKVHSIVDEVGIKYIKQSGILKLFPKSFMRIQAVKVFMDTVLRDKIGDWSKILEVFNTVYEEELAYGMDKITIEKWHKIIVSALTIKSSDKFLDFFKELNVSGRLAKEIVLTVEGVKDSEKASKITKEFYDSFETLIRRPIEI